MGRDWSSGVVELEGREEAKGGAGERVKGSSSDEIRRLGGNVLSSEGMPDNITGSVSPGRWGQMF